MLINGLRINKKMSKYLCICGVDFRKKKQANDHVKFFNQAQSAWPHQVIKRGWKALWIDFLIASRRYWKFTGFLIIYFTILYHFRQSTKIILIV